MSRRAKKLSAGQTVPALAPHEQVDLKLRQMAGRIADHFLEFADLALAAIEQKVYERFGFLDEAAYFTERVGVSYRTIRRWLSVAEGLRRLPEGERAEARQAVARLGVHKSAALATVLGKDGHNWREMVAFADKATAEAVQARVSEATGALPRGPIHEPGERFLKALLNAIPPGRIPGTSMEYADYVAHVWRAAMRHFEYTSPISVLLEMVDTMNADLGKDGVDPKADAS